MTPLDKSLDVEKYRKIIRTEMEIQGVSVPEIAGRAGLEQVTVFRFINNVTSRPALTTVTSMLDALALKVTIVQRPQPALRMY